MKTAAHKTAARMTALHVRTWEYRVADPQLTHTSPAQPRRMVTARGDARETDDLEVDETDGA